MFLQKHRLDLVSGVLVLQDGSVSWSLELCGPNAPLGPRTSSRILIGTFL